IRRVDPVRNNADHHVVGHQLAPRHDRLGLLAEFRSLGHGGTRPVAGRKLNQPVTLLNTLGLRALAGTGRTQKDELHLRAPRSLDFLIRPSYWCASRWLCIWATVSMVTLTTISSDVPPK